MISLPWKLRRQGIDVYNAECENIVMRYAGEWENIVERMGRWIDFKNGAFFCHVVCRLFWSERTRVYVSTCIVVFGLWPDLAFRIPHVRSMSCSPGPAFVRCLSPGRLQDDGPAVHGVGLVGL